MNLEPVYAILLAVTFLGEGEQLRWRFSIAVGVILAAVLSHIRFQTQELSGDHAGTRSSRLLLGHERAAPGFVHRIFAFTDIEFRKNRLEMLLDGFR